MSDVRIVTVDESNLGKVRMLCGHSPIYRAGYTAKMEWMRARLAEGMRYQLVQAKAGIAGMIEYMPGEFAWRGVDARGYIFIHCLWIVGRNRKHGYGRKLLEACLEEAGGTRGVAVMSSRTHWLPTRKIFLKNGFEVVDERAPYELLVKRFDPQAPLPSFKRTSHDIPLGLTLYHSDQCPYMQNMPRNVEEAGKQLGIPVNIIHLQSGAQAQDFPCPYGVLGIFYNGELIDYRPTGTEKLLGYIRNKMEQSA